MIHLKSTLFLTLILPVFISNAQTVTYIANEGVMIEYNGSKVLVDALFDEYDLKFDAPVESTITQMMTGTAPFDGVDLVLVTHAHRDHFNGQIGVDYMNANKDARMIASAHAVDSMKMYSDSYAKVSSRVTTYPWKKGWKLSSQGPITIKSSYMLHAGKKNFKTQNQIFAITIADKKIIHLGDTQMEREQFDNLRLEYDDFDIAIVPFWYLTSVFGAEIIRKYTHAKKVIAVHLPKANSGQFDEKILTQFPNATIFTEAGQSVGF